jgi:hypothetical protein
MEETEEKKKRNDHGIPSVGTVSRRRARARARTDAKRVCSFHGSFHGYSLTRPRLLQEDAAGIRQLIIARDRNPSDSSLTGPLTGPKKPRKVSRCRADKPDT